MSIDNNTNNINIDQNMSDQALIRRDKLNDLKLSKKDPFLNTKAKQEIHSSDIIDKFEEIEGKDVYIAGRMMSCRKMGKASFFDIHDNKGKIQVYLKLDEVGEESYTDFDKWDIGDILEVCGYVFKTKRGEISIHAKKVKLLAKSLLPLPDKFHGLTNTDLRYRQRYIDLIVNPDIKDTFVKRSKIVKSIRNFLDKKDYIEVETPMLNNIPGGANARPFITHHNSLDMDLYLRIAPELYLKRLIIGGLEKVYEIGRNFRNEGMDRKHNPEFTTVELYEAYTDYLDMMDLTEEMVKDAARSIGVSESITYQSKEIDILSRFDRISMIDAVNKFTGIDFSEFNGDTIKAKEIAKSLNIEYKNSDNWGNILNKVFEEKVEEKLVQPTFIYDYPVEVSPLTKRKRDNSLLVERFELFITGHEFANAYSELNDPIDQKERFLDQIRLREAGDEEANMLDSDFLHAMEYGMPPTGGMGLGVDRLVMLLTDSPSIRDVLFFPTMKPQN